ncbi:hypothetical protein F6455_10220 [Proteobacteria bacterium 005FR1]|nr:hypothetical protein [Proteobacteria bacterium 005FR1]
MMKVIRTALPLLLLAAMTGCKNGTLQHEAPARLAEQSDAARAELEQIIAKAAGAYTVTLAEHPFADSSVLLVERRPQRDPQGHRLPGRDLGNPERFQLLVSGEDCILLQESTGKRWELREANCLPQ